MLGTLPRGLFPSHGPFDSHTASYDIELSHMDAELSERSLLDSHASDTEHDDFSRDAARELSHAPLPLQWRTDDTHSSYASSPASSAYMTAPTAHSFLDADLEPQYGQSQSQSEFGQSQSQSQSESGQSQSQSQPESTTIATATATATAKKPKPQHKQSQSRSVPRRDSSHIVPVYVRPYYYVPSEAEKDFDSMVEWRRHSQSSFPHLNSSSVSASLVSASASLSLSSSSAAAIASHKALSAAVGPQQKNRQHHPTAAILPFDVAPPHESGKQPLTKECKSCGSPVVETRSYCRRCIHEDVDLEDSTCCGCSIS
eukprot:TRINITY_DN473_c0_g2_i2.p1 TRINITY_DN473_c0_g2~~TRINITY_DN473_c0_g2_i2.p1  ORF type:complete len:314 (+),score=52.56 TRINITY_DN473_c0_g2_i2:64-1005(+)